MDKTFVIYYVSMALMENKKKIFEECENTLLETYRASCVVWFHALIVTHSSIADVMGGDLYANPFCFSGGLRQSTVCYVL